ncbi:MAG: hypothetical protein ABTQ34_02445 [Bdellovibrionales bacterium]
MTRPQNKQEMMKYLDSLNTGFQNKFIEISDRPILAIQQYHFDFNEPIALTGPLSTFINDYFSARYGKKNHKQFMIGEAVILLAGAPYRVIFPMIFGKISCNPFDWIEDTSPGCFYGLSSSEIDSYANQLTSYYEAFRNMQILPINTGISDIKITVSAIMQFPRQCGAARWNSQQALEKALKHYIRINHGNDRLGHKMKHLITEAIRCGLPPPTRFAVDLT